MPLAALDPSMLLYQEDDWRTRSTGLLARITALNQHRHAVKRYGIRIVISQELAAFITQYFPWNRSDGSIGELRDLKQFVLEDLTRAEYVCRTRDAGRVSLQPESATCRDLKNPSVWNVWKELLCACVERQSCTGIQTQVATWVLQGSAPDVREIAITIVDAPSRQYFLPLVWDEISWAERLDYSDFWPDLEKCVWICFRSNPGMRDYSHARESPISFQCTKRFWSSVSASCQPQTRPLLVKALAKKVFGIGDSSLGDEAIGGMIRRFRVTDFWRVHYREDGGGIQLLEFGPHDMGL